jgi:hypothetical protein
MACELPDIAGEIGKWIEQAITTLIGEIRRIVGEVITAVVKFIENLFTAIKEAIEKVISGLFPPPSSQPTPSPTSPPTDVIAYGNDNPPENGMYIHVPQNITRLNLREGPGSTYRSMAHLAAGQYYGLLEIGDSWVRINTSIGEGWTSAQYIEIVVSPEVTPTSPPQPFPTAWSNNPDCNVSHIYWLKSPIACEESVLNAVTEIGLSPACIALDENPLGYYKTHTVYEGWILRGADNILSYGWYPDREKNLTVIGPAIVTNQFKYVECGIPGNP